MVSDFRNTRSHLRVPVKHLGQEVFEVIRNIYIYSMPSHSCDLGIPKSIRSVIPNVSVKQIIWARGCFGIRPGISLEIHRKQYTSKRKDITFSAILNGYFLVDFRRLVRSTT